MEYGYGYGYGYQFREKLTFFGFKWNWFPNFVHYGTGYWLLVQLQIDSRWRCSTVLILSIDSFNIHSIHSDDIFDLIALNSMVVLVKYGEMVWWCDVMWFIEKMKIHSDFDWNINTSKYYTMLWCLLVVLCCIVLYCVVLCFVFVGVVVCLVLCCAEEWMQIGLVPRMEWVRTTSKWGLDVWPFLIVIEYSILSYSTVGTNSTYLYCVR